MGWTRTRSNGRAGSAFAATAFAGITALVAAGCGSGQILDAAAPSTASQSVTAVAAEGPAVTVTGPDDIRASLKDAAITQPLVFDGGGLRLDPPAPGSPLARHTAPLTEEHAIELARAQTPFGASIVSLALVGRALATVKVPITYEPLATGPAMNFEARPVWVVVTAWGPHSCPAMTAQPGATTPTPEPLDIDLFAADGTGEGVAYSTAGARCGQPITANATVGLYHLSPTWAVLSRSDTQLTVGIPAQPPCADLEGSGGSNQGGAATLQLDVVVLMGPVGCKLMQARTTWTLPLAKGAALPSPGPTGLLSAMTVGTGPGQGFVYYDGQTHTIT